MALLLLAISMAAGAQSGALGDPTKPTPLQSVEESQVQGPRWRLQSTLVADTRRLAVINGQTVSEGERIQGARLLEVRQDGVTLDVDGERVNVRLLQGAANVKRTGG